MYVIKYANNASTNSSQCYKFEFHRGLLFLKLRNIQNIKNINLKINHKIENISEGKMNKILDLVLVFLSKLVLCDAAVYQDGYFNLDCQFKR